MEKQAQSELYAGHFDQAERSFKTTIATLDARERDSKSKPALQAQLAQSLEKQNKWDEAEDTYKDCLSLAERKFGADSEEVIGPLEGLRALYYQQKKYEESETFGRKVLAVEEKNFKPNDPRIEFALSNIIAASCIYGKCKDDTQLLTRFLSMRERRYGGDSAQTCAARQLFAESLMHHQKYTQAADLFMRNVMAYERTAHNMVPASLTDYGAAMLGAGKDSQAMAALERALKIERAAPTQYATNIIATLGTIARIQISQNNNAAAVRTYKEMTETARTTIGKDNPLLADYLVHYADVLKKSGKTKEAARIQAEAERLYHLKQEQPST